MNTKPLTPLTKAQYALLEETRFVRTLKEFTFHGYSIPSYMHEGIINYVFHGIPPGHFLYAVLVNDLHRACMHADGENLWKLPVYHAFFYNHLPSKSWGSPATVREYMINLQEEFRQNETISNIP